MKKGDSVTKKLLIACLLLTFIYSLQQQAELTRLESKYGKDSHQVFQHLRRY